MKDPSVIEKEYRRLSTPRAAAIAGILFGVLFSISLVLLRGAIPENIAADHTWVTSGAARVNLALGLMPFAAIAYLWFIGVVRDKLGEYEDRFFSTVFFGSSLLFLAMIFISMGIAGGILATYPMIDGASQDPVVIFFGHALMHHISNVYALRMAGVTMISLATIWIRTGLMPRWLALLTYLLALALLVVTNFGLWVTLIFPGWVVLVSLLILRIRFKQTQGQILAPE
jgi:hypothetical protein